MATLDRSRSFGQVYGPSVYSYEQDGKYFDHEGNEMPDGIPSKGRKRAAEPVAEAQPVDDQISSQLES